MAFNPSQDLNAIQRLIMQDETILDLLDLTGKSNVEIAKRIIKRSQWNDLATNEKRLCIFFIPDRSMKNEAFRNSTIEVNIHTPALHDYKAWQALERVNKLLHKEKINNRYLYLYGQLGELPTMQGFFCCGTRFNFNRLI